MQQLLNRAITANQIEGSVSASSPTIKQNELKQIVQNLISKQGKHWPDELNADALTDNLKLFHLPYWVVSGKGSAQWSASIGVDRQVPKRCSTCGGRGRYTPIWSTDERRCDNCAGTGQALGTETFWSSQSGFVEAEASNQVRENFDSTALNLKCGDRQFKVNSFWVENTQTSTYNVIAPASANGTAGKHAAQLAVEDALRNKARSIASGMGSVRDLQVGYVQTSNEQFETWLYPMYLGYYAAGNEQLPIQIDGITKKIWAEIPSGVKDLRRKDRNRKIAYGIATLITLAIFILVADFLVMVSHPCGGLDNLVGNPTGCVQGLDQPYTYWWDSATVSPDGTLVAAKSDEDIQIWRVTDGQVLHRQLTFNGGGSQVEGLTFSPSSEVLAAGYDGNVVLWSISSGKPLHTFRFAQGQEYNWVRTLSFSPDGKLLAASFRHGPAKVWQLSDNSLLHTLSVPNDTVRSIVFSPNGQLMASGSDNGTIRIWQVSNGNVIQTLDGNSKWVSIVKFSPDGQLLASIEGDNSIRIWRVSDGALLQTMKIDIPNQGWVNDLDFSPDSNTLAVAVDNNRDSNDSRVQFWQVENGKLLNSEQTGLAPWLVGLRGEWNEMIGADFAPNGNLFVIQQQSTQSNGFLTLQFSFDPGTLYPVVALIELEP